MRGGNLTPIHLLALSLVTLILFNRHRHKNANHENILCWAGEGIRVSALNPIASTRRSKFFDNQNRLECAEGSGYRLGISARERRRIRRFLAKPFLLKILRRLHRVAIENKELKRDMKC